MSIPPENDNSTASKEMRYERFIEWTEQNGAYVHPSLKFVVTANRGAELVVHTGGEVIKPFESLFRAPYAASLSYFNAVSAGTAGSPYRPHSTSLPNDYLESTADHDTVGAIFLVQQYLLGDKSFWFPYIQILPQPEDPNDSAIPLVWTEMDLAWLQGTHLREAVRKQHNDLEQRWTVAALATLEHCGWDTSQYTVKLGLWAHYCFLSRNFWSIALQADVSKFRTEFQRLVTNGVNLDDTVKVLLPLLETQNHSQDTTTEYELNEGGFTVSKNAEMKPGDTVNIPYDLETHRFNNTLLLKEFGFILQNNEASELVLPFPFDLAEVKHPSHDVFSSHATPEIAYGTSQDKYRSLVTVRCPLQDRRGPVNPHHPVPWLRHFHPTLVSMVSFRVANLVERAVLRDDPEIIPSERNRRASVEYLSSCLYSMLCDLEEQGKILGQAQNERQRRAQAYRLEQVQILGNILQDLRVTGST